MKHPVVKFLIRSGVVFILWVFVYKGYIEPKGIWDIAVVNNITDLSKLLLSVSGYELADLTDAYPNTIRYLKIVGTEKAIYVGDECNGLNLFALFTGFILVFPGSWLRKLWFIPLGIVIIHLANVGRVSMLTILQYHQPQWVEFNHTYTFTVVVYSVVFLLWYLWATKVSGLKRSINEGQ